VFRLGYNTNGFAHHRVPEALEVLSQLGYEGVAITPDVAGLDPYRLHDGEVSAVRTAADGLGLSLAIETGARYLLDPARKHRPNLLDETPSDRERRLDFLRRSVDLAAELGAGVVSIWAGAAADGRVGDADEPPPCEDLWDRLCEGVTELLLHAGGSDVRVAFEPEPGMFVERPRGYDQLVRRLGSAGEELGLCLDVGHLLATHDRPEADVVRAYGARLAQVHLDDSPVGRHEHVLPGTADLDLPGVLNALLEVNYTGMVAVELSRDSHRAPEMAAAALDAVRAALLGADT
jgi:sugar phosphate isomerase/epimerase